jgi:excisionase family DNA binding protein
MDKETKPFEPLVDSHQAAALLGIHPKTLQKMARAGTVPCHRIGDLWRFRASELDRWLHTGEGRRHQRQHWVENLSSQLSFMARSDGSARWRSNGS